MFHNTEFYNIEHVQVEAYDNLKLLYICIPFVFQNLHFLLIIPIYIYVLVLNLFKQIFYANYFYIKLTEKKLVIFAYKRR